MFCQNCGTQLSDNAKFCPACGAGVGVRTPQTAAPVPAQPQVGGAGYSPVVNMPEFRQLAAKDKNASLSLLMGLLIIICVCVVLIVIGFLIFDDLIALVIVTAVVLSLAIPYTTIILRRINRKKRPPFEVTVWKYLTTKQATDMIRDPGFLMYFVYFKDGAGRSIRTSGPLDKRFQEYYQIGDRCLYHCDIGFFEKYDKSRDTFSLCPFCMEIVELGQTRCTKCNKPLLI